MGKHIARFSEAIATLASITLLSSCSNTSKSEDRAPAPPADPPSFVTGEVLVKFKSVYSAQSVQTSLAQSGLESRDYFAAIGVHRCRITNQVDALTASRACSQDSMVAYAEPNYIYKASVLPNDPLLAELWGLQNGNDVDIDAPEAWDVMQGSRDVVVGVIDTGVDYAHEDLSANMWRNPGESGNGKETNGIDDDGNGYIDDVHGWDFVANDNDPMDDNEHGSHVAGTIAAVGNNGVGVVGVNWKASIMALKFLDRNGSGSASDAISAILYGAANGAHIQNNSWGGGGFSQALQDAIEFARDRNVLFVAAAGNEGRNNDTTPSYPANYAVSTVVSIAASDRNEQLASFSNFGATTVDFAAPGVDILSTTPGNRYQSFSGTSMATPHTAGAAALVIARFPGIDQRAVQVRLASSVDVLPVYANRTVTGGRLNVLGALSTSPHVAFVTRLRDTTSEGPYAVSAEAVDDVAIALVELVFSANAGPEIAVAMVSSVPTLYEAEIDAQTAASVVRYFIKATDTSGNSHRSQVYSFQVGGDDNGGDPPAPCGNVALTLPGGTSPGGQAVLMLASIALLWLPAWAVSRRTRHRTSA
jgi:subtilisin family serine protease